LFVPSSISLRRSTRSLAQLMVRAMSHNGRPPGRNLPLRKNESASTNPKVPVCTVYKQAAARLRGFNRRCSMLLLAHTQSQLSPLGPPGSRHGIPPGPFVPFFLLFIGRPGLSSNVPRLGPQPVVVVAVAVVPWAAGPTTATMTRHTGHTPLPPPPVRQPVRPPPSPPCSSFSSSSCSCASSYSMLSLSLAHTTHAPWRGQGG